MTWWATPIRSSVSAPPSSPTTTLRGSTGATKNQSILVRRRQRTPLPAPGSSLHDGDSVQPGQERATELRAHLLQGGLQVQERTRLVAVGHCAYSGNSRVQERTHKTVKQISVAPFPWLVRVLVVQPERVPSG